MDTLIETFHLDAKLIIAQLVNFIIVATVLWFFALKPLMKIMRERTATIEKSLDEAVQIEQRLEQTKQEQEQIIQQAKREAAEVIGQARDRAEQERSQSMQKTKEEVTKIVADAKDSIAAERMRMVTEAQREVMGFVVAVTEKVLQESLPDSVDKKVIEKAVKDIQQ